MVHLASVASIAALLASVHAIDVTFENKCSTNIDLYDNSKTDTLSSGKSTVRTLSSGFSGMFRHGKNDQATLAEFAVSGGRTWFDISVVPPGSGSCTSYENCKSVTGKTGYNVAMSITPDTSKTDSTCKTLTCESASCSDAYLYPKDDGKTHSCEDSVPIKVTFCPSGSASNSTSSSTGSSTTTTATSTTATTSSSSTTSSSTSKSSTSTFTSSSSYQSGTVKSSAQQSSSSNSSSSGTTISGATTTTASSFTYSGSYAGTGAGTYNRVTATKTCTRETVSLTNNVGPMSEEVTMVFRGPMNIYNIAVFDGSSSGDWTRVSSYANGGETNDMVFMNNLNIDYSGNNKSPQGYSSADGLTAVSSATTFGGWLAEASDPSNTSGGPGVATGAEVNIMRKAKCSDESGCLGYYDSNGHHGWSGGKKMFVTKVKMPAGSSPNQPAIWMLNAQVVRSNQYQCNCRGSGSVGGCGELDVAEVIETNSARDKVSTHYYFYDGSVAAGKDNYAERPSSSATTYLTIFDSDESVIKILEIGADEFDFSATAVSESQIKTWLSGSSSSSSSTSAKQQ